MITIIVGLLAALWTLIQIIAFVREKDPSHLKIALVLLLVLIGGVFALRHLGPKHISLFSRAGSPKPVPASTPLPTPVPQKRGEVKTSFVIDIRRNLLGGLNDIGAICTFAETGGVEVEAVAYTITIRYLDSPSDSPEAALTRTFERTLPERITIPADQTVEKRIVFDREIGDLVQKYDKSGNTGAITINWMMKDEKGNPVSESK